MRRSERFTVGDRARVEIHIPTGTIEAREGGAGVVLIDIDSGDAEDLVVSQVGDTISVRHPERWGWRVRSARVVAVVPMGTEVELVSTSGDMRVSGSLGTARLRTTSGQIEVDTVARLELSSTSGDSRVREVLDDCTVTTVSGDCVITHVGGRLTSTHVSGDLRGSHIEGDLRVGTTSGDVRIERCDGDEVAMKTISGTLDLGLPTGIRVEADLSTLSGRATYPDAGKPAPEPTGPRRTVRLAARSISGDITIRRART
jgi:DUF4097 and DUF4098 domain-containing protein YvlB